MVDVLTTKRQDRKEDGSAFIFAVADPSLLRKAGTEQVCQVWRASMAVQTYAPNDGRVSEYIFTLLAQKTVSPTF